MNIATYITSLRIFLIIPIAFFINLETIWFNFVALIIFLLAALTDYLDGYVARKMKNETPLGALLDLLADKLLVCLTLVILLMFNNNFFFAIPALMIISRELIISSIRQFIVEKQGKNNMNVSLLGKSKTTLQFVSISLIIISPDLGHLFYIISISSLWLASLVSLASLIRYLFDWNKLVN
jgi:CDP-diacylglycerol---glycerol-3-phosphate 3-phosphatidyltransferase